MNVLAFSSFCFPFCSIMFDSLSFRSASLYLSLSLSLSLSLTHHRVKFLKISNTFALKTKFAFFIFLEFSSDEREVGSTMILEETDPAKKYARLITEKGNFWFFCNFKTFKNISLWILTSETRLGDFYYLETFWISLMVKQQSYYCAVPQKRFVNSLG